MYRRIYGCNPMGSSRYSLCSIQIACRKDTADNWWKNRFNKRISMKKVFWDNPYQTYLETKVIQVDGNTVVLDETIGFSESGGQESDRLTINGIEVLSS